MKTIGDILKAKGRGPIHCVTPDETVFAAVSKMVENNIGAILVKEGDVIRGIMSERDYLRFIARQGKTARDTPVKELMTSKVIFVTPIARLDEVMALMTEARIRHVPVLEEGDLLGIISIGDVVKQIAQDQQAQISALESYIYDPYPGPTRA
ncbi:MAG: CBS domain-containing protein [Candidatus Krumholzibacteriia bacterium]